MHVLIYMYSLFHFNFTFYIISFGIPRFTATFMAQIVTWKVQNDSSKACQYEITLDVSQSLCKPRVGKLIIRFGHRYLI